jgi:hypothetical protein
VLEHHQSSREIAITLYRVSNERLLPFELNSLLLAHLDYLSNNRAGNTITCSSCQKSLTINGSS